MALNFLRQLAVSTDDWVFLPEERKREEYVTNEEGIIYQGSGKYITPLRWDYGQVLTLSNTNTTRRWRHRARS